METCFDTDTGLTRVDDTTFEAVMNRRWWILRGPNGGYVAAVILRALTEAVADPARPVRTLTIHYTAPPQEGPATLTTTVERQGRSLTTVSLRFRQGERLLAVALAGFSSSREAPEFDHTVMADVPPAPECPLPDPLPGAPPMYSRYHYRPAIGGQPFAGSEEAVTGGWIRLAEPRALDAPLAAAYLDAWSPAVFTRLGPDGSVRLSVPTVEFTFHFRTPLPLPAMEPDDYALAVFRSRLSHDGFIEEDGELWSPDGTLLVQGRQLAVVI